MPLQYKFVEISPVTEETLEVAVNEWVSQGWELEGVRFVVTEHSKRPQLAFVSFVRMVTDGRARPVEPEAVKEPGVEPVEEGLPRVIVSPQGDDVE